MKSMVKERFGFWTAPSRNENTYISDVEMSSLCDEVISSVVVQNLLLCHVVRDNR